MFTSQNIALALMMASLIAVLAALSSGCQNSTETWPSQPQHDWAKNVQGKGMANVWGVVFDVADIGQGPVSIRPEVELGPSSERTTGKNTIVLGTTTIELQTTGTDAIKLSINGRDYGTVLIDNRVTVNTEGEVDVDGERRKPE